VPACLRSCVHASHTPHTHKHTHTHTHTYIYKVKGGRYTLAEVSLAVWHGVVASGAVAQDFMPGTQFAGFTSTTVQILTQQPLCLLVETNPFDFGLTLDKLVLADGWEEHKPTVPTEGAAPVYRHAKSGSLGLPPHALTHTYTHTHTHTHML